MNSSFTREQVHLAAQYYYKDGLGQAEVAKRVNVSQAKVSRLLALAREEGIVQITVVDYDPRESSLEQKLRKKYSLKNVIVVRTVPDLAPEHVRNSVAHFSAPHVMSWLKKHTTIAIAGGRSLAELIHKMTSPEQIEIRIVQAMGNIDSQIEAVDAIELGRVLANQWDAPFYTLNTPAFLPDIKTKQIMLGLESVKTTVGLFKKLDFALVGIGSLENSIFSSRRVLDADDIRLLQAKGAVGEICGRYFNSEGVECESSFKERVIGVQLDELRRTTETVAIVTEHDRAAAIQAAIKGKLIKSLITDKTTAEAIL